MKSLAGQVVDASGHKGQSPKNDGELFTSAWCGLLKYWILGEPEKAMQQLEIISKSHRPTECHPTTKPMVIPWLKSDQASFVKNQQKDFEKFWNRYRKYPAILKETPDEITFDMKAVSSIGQVGSWSHCGLALLAHRRGWEVATDPFWFPAHALEVMQR